MPERQQVFYDVCHPSIPGGKSEYKAVVAELVDALDLGSSVFGVRVRVSPTAPYNRHFPIESPMRIRK